MTRKAFIIIILFMFVFMVNPVSAQSSPVYPEYEIQSGDTLGFIAAKFNTTVNEIVRVNQLINPDLLSPGQTIKIPSYEGVTGLLKSVSLNLGDSFTYLPILYHSKIDEVISINKILSPSQLFTGSEVILALDKGNPPLKPMFLLSEGISGLEVAILTNSNPNTLSLLNTNQNINTITSHRVIFGFESSQSPTINLFAPELSSVTISPLPLEQGSTASIIVNSESPVSLTGFLDTYPLKFFSETPGKYFSLQGIHALSEPGLKDFSITAEFEDGQSVTYSQVLYLMPGNFDQAKSVVLKGKTENGVFVAEQMLVKCPSKYQGVEQDPTRHS